MNDLSAFGITKKWPARHPDRLQLYSLPTPNGVKVSIALEELGLPYEPHLVRFDTDDQLSPEFLSLNPNNKIPAIIDPDGPGGRPLALFESGAILIYLAEKTGRLMSADPATRYETIQWVMFQMAGVGPMFGQVGFFHKFAGKAFEDKRPRDRYVAESRRLLGVLDQRLAEREWLMSAPRPTTSVVHPPRGSSRPAEPDRLKSAPGPTSSHAAEPDRPGGDDYSIADIATFPWINNLIGFYEARELVGFDDFANVSRALKAFLARPAVARGLNIPARPAA